MKFLIVPGFAKSGTTFLYEQLVQSGASLNIPEFKELDYFITRSGFSGYLENFKTADPEKVFLDASPLYSISGKNIRRRIQETLRGHEVKFIFCLREPIARAYSHYMHDVSSHFYLYGHAPYSFYSADALKKYFVPLAREVQAYIDMFGEENVSAFGFESTGPDLAADILEYIGLDKDWKLNFSVNPARGNSIPRVHYDSKRHITLQNNGVLYAVPPRTFLIASTRFPQYRPDFPEEFANILKDNAATWDRQFDPKFLGDAVNIIREDYLNCFDILGMKHECLAPPKVIFASDPPPFGEDVCANFQRLGTVSATVANSYASKPGFLKYLRPLAFRILFRVTLAI